MTESYDITINQGATYSLIVTWEVAGVAVDLTGYTAAMQARHDIKSTTTFINITSATSAIVLGGAAGMITITLSASVTALITECYGVYDLELTSSGGTVTRLMQGSITVSGEVTR